MRVARRGLALSTARESAEEYVFRKTNTHLALVLCRTRTGTGIGYGCVYTAVHGRTRVDPLPRYLVLGNGSTAVLNLVIPTY